MAIDTTTKIVRFSLNPHILSLNGKHAALSFPFKVGSIIKNAKVIRVDPGIGALLALPDTTSANEDDEEDDDFDNEEGDDDDDESDLAEDNDMEKRLLKEKIGKDELDALSITSGAASGSSDNENTGTSDDEEDSSDDEDNSNSGDGSSSDSNNPAPRRSKRRKFTLPGPDASGDDEGGNSDIGKLDVSNIVRGSRRRKAVDYRKLADIMFGDEEDEDAKGGLKKEYTPHEE